MILIDTQILFKYFLTRYFMILKLQKLRTGTSEQAYRIALPKSLIEHYKYQDKKFLVEFKNGKIILTPLD